MCIYIYIHMYVYIYIYKYVSIYTYLCTYIHICICAFIYIYNMYSVSLAFQPHGLRSKVVHKLVAALFSLLFAQKRHLIIYTQTYISTHSTHMSTVYTLFVHVHVLSCSYTSYINIPIYTHIHMTRHH